jgi:hypothetical protein|tara:strand:- start:24 stop:359 length:336 start_codon:yes stop_codon:yes gene_type:complete
MSDYRKKDSLIYRFAPECWDHWLTLQPFHDVIHSYNAGPQPERKRDDPNEPQHIELDFSLWEKGEIIIPRIWRIEKDRVMLQTMDGYRPSSMQRLWDFLRQVPRDPEWFAE